MTTAGVILSALVLLQIKHVVADFFLQPRYVWANKGRYGHPGGILHALVHIVLSLPALIFLGASASLIGLVCIVEGLVHYHVDFAKERLTRKLALQIDRPGYWYLFGLDQGMHQATYLGMIWLALL